MTDIGPEGVSYCGALLRALRLFLILRGGNKKGAHQRWLATGRENQHLSEPSQRHVHKRHVLLQLWTLWVMNPPLCPSVYLIPWNALWSCGDTLLLCTRYPQRRGERDIHKRTQQTEGRCPVHIRTNRKQDHNLRSLLRRHKTTTDNVRLWLHCDALETSVRDQMIAPGPVWGKNTGGFTLHRKNPSAKKSNTGNILHVFRPYWSQSIWGTGASGCQQFICVIITVRAAISNID